jgi:hypothetical protein
MARKMRQDLAGELMGDVDDSVAALYRKPGPGIGYASVDPIEPEGQNRRSSPRKRVLRRALIVYRDGHCTLGCNILNVSETGALLMPADLGLCPSMFVLKPQDGPQHRCEVVWRKGGMVGVRFV